MKEGRREKMEMELELEVEVASGRAHNDICEQLHPALKAQIGTEAETRTASLYDEKHSYLYSSDVTYS